MRDRTGGLCPVDSRVPQFEENVAEQADGVLRPANQCRPTGPSLKRKAELSQIAFQIANYINDRGVKGSERCLVREMTELLLRDC